MCPHGHQWQPTAQLLYRDERAASCLERVSDRTMLIPKRPREEGGTWECPAYWKSRLKLECLRLFFLELLKIQSNCGCKSDQLGERQWPGNGQRDSVCEAETLRT